jgi:hypothetical protein
MHWPDRAGRHPGEQRVPERRPNHRTRVRHPLRGARHARHGGHQPPAGHPGRTGHSQGGRQCGGCRDRRQRHARAGGAHRLRHRRRFVRHRLGCGIRQAPRAECQRPLAARPGPAVVSRQRLRAHPALRTAAGECARRRRRLVRAARPLRPGPDARSAGAGDPLCPRGISAHRGDRVLLGAQRRADWRVSGLRRGVHAGRAGAGQGRDLPQPGPGRHLRAPCRGGPRRLLQGRNRPRHRRLYAGERGLPRLRGSRQRIAPSGSPRSR